MLITSFPGTVSLQGGRYCKLIVSSVGNSLCFLSTFCFSCVKFYGSTQIESNTRNHLKWFRYKWFAESKSYQSGRSLGHLGVARVPGSSSLRRGVLINGTCAIFTISNRLHYGALVYAGYAKRYRAAAIKDAKDVIAMLCLKCMSIMKWCKVRISKSQE